MNGSPAGALTCVFDIDRSSKSPGSMRLLGGLRGWPRKGRIRLEAGQQCVQACVALLPVVLVTDEPGGSLAEVLRLEVAESSGLASTARDETRSLKHLEMPRDRRLRHAERLHELADGLVAALGQPGEDGATSRVGQGTEDGVERIWLHLDNHYVIERCGD